MNQTFKRKKMTRYLKIFIFMSLITLLGMLVIGPNSVGAAEKAVHYYDELIDVCMLDTGDAWAVGHRGKFIHSKNYGKDWETLATNTNKGLFSVWFVTPEKGWITGENGLILYTEDGGKTLTPQGKGVTDKHLLKSFFLNETKGWAVGPSGTVLTTDDGVTWRKTSYARDLRFNEVYFFDENKGVAAIEFDTIMSTEDGGETWSALLEGEESWDEEPGNFFGIDFIDENTGVVVGTAGNIKYTRDGGQTWETAENNDTSKLTLLKVKFFNDKQGVAIGLDGGMVFTKDGGISWDPPSPVTQFTWFSGIALLEDGKGVVVGVGNVIVTDDFGKTWVSPFLN